MVETVTKLPVKNETKAEMKTFGQSRPWHALETLRHQIDRLFSDFDSGFGFPPFRRSLFDYLPAERFAGSASVPAVDITEKGRRL